MFFFCSVDESNGQEKVKKKLDNINKWKGIGGEETRGGLLT